MNRTFRIVMTGAPASGKTKIFDRLKEDKLTIGFLFFEELARQFLERSPDIRLDPAQFHTELYAHHIKRENEAGNSSFVTDRGTIDAFAFHPETIDAVGTTIETEYLRYTHVIQLGSAAKLGDQFFVGDSIRKETVSETLKIEKSLIGVWSGHPNYEFINAEVDFEVKYANFMVKIAQILKEPK